MNALKRKKPWYKRFKEEFLKASAYMAAFDFWRDLPEINIYRDFEKLTLTRFIFESNNFEKEGLPRADTRELIIDEFEKYPDLEKFFLNNLSIQLGLVFDDATIEKILVEKNQEIDIDKIPFIAKYKSKSKEAATVAKHLGASMLADIRASMVSSERQLKNYFIILKNKANKGETEAERKNAKEMLDEHFSNFPLEGTKLLSEEICNNIHETMAEDLIDEKYEPAGKYRKHSVITQLDSSFPHPSSINRAMDRFYSKYDEIEKIENVHPIIFSSWVKTNFILIHPYSDFNGRMSRLIMNMILRSYQIPFWVVLRSNKKDRHRYMTAIRHYRRGNRQSMVTLIAIHLNQGFDEFNNLLQVSDLPEIPFKQYYDRLCEAASSTNDTELFTIFWSHLED